jgi:hypothetical protein
MKGLTSDYSFRDYICNQNFDFNRLIASTLEIPIILYTPKMPWDERVCHLCDTKKVEDEK